MNRDRDLVAMAREGLVYAVIDDLVYEMMESARPGIADVHGRPFSDSLQTLQHLDRFGAISLLCHVSYPRCCGPLRPPLLRSLKYSNSGGLKQAKTPIFTG